MRMPTLAPDISVHHLLTTRCAFVVCAHRMHTVAQMDEFIRPDATELGSTSISITQNGGAERRQRKRHVRPRQHRPLRASRWATSHSSGFSGAIVRVVCVSAR